ncbi:MAG: efflux RND transporter periplasmic adaptor subunit [Bacteroidota bacterium]
MNQLKLILPIFFTLTLLACNSNGKKIIEESGIIEAIEVVVSSHVAGKILKLTKEEGAVVSAGDTILIIDHELLEIQLKQVLAGRDIAKAQLDLLIKGARKEDIKQIEEALNQAEANFAVAKTDKERMDNLFKSNSVTKKQVEDAAARYEIAQAQLNAAKENFYKIKNIARSEEITQAQANFKKAEAAVEAIQKSIRDCYVTSPINGFIVKKFVEVGETVAMFSSLFKVSDLSTVELVVYISETDLGKIKLGQKANIAVDSFPNKTYEGKVIYISTEAEFTPKNIQTKDERTKLVFAVKIKIPNQNFELKTGMPADVIINVKG